MLRRIHLLAGTFSLLFFTCSWGAETITYVRKVSTTNFLGWGQAGFYFPQFGAPGIAGPKRPEDNMQFNMPNWLEFQFDEADNKRTFSPDADFYDCNPAPPACAGRGVYSRGGYTAWDSFTLSNGLTGRSGSIVDEHAAGNTNNSVNRIQMKNGVPSSFCMHIVTDNTANSHDSAGGIVVRGGRDGQGSFDPNADIPDLSFDGITDVHTFRFDNFRPDDFIKIRLNSGYGGMAPGFGGLMFDSACDSIPGEQCGDALCNITLGETCETCPGDCGACVSGKVKMGSWLHHGVDPQSHYQEGSNRLLIFTAHGVDNTHHWVQGVTYGNKRMIPLLSRDQNRKKRASISVWYLKEPDIYSADNSQFAVDWYHKPGDRSYESVFLSGVSQTKPFDDIDTSACNDCYVVACPGKPLEAGHISLYAATHERQGYFLAPDSYNQGGDHYMGGNGRATMGHKLGIGNPEAASVNHNREGALVLGCLEVQDSPTTVSPDSDNDGVPDASDNCTLANNGPLATDAGGNVQLDTNGDGYGNMCDGDLNNDGYVNTPDQALFRNALYSQPGDSNWNEHADLDGDGYVSTPDVVRFGELVGKAVGPAGEL